VKAYWGVAVRRNSKKEAKQAETQMDRERGAGAMRLPNRYIGSLSFCDRDRGLKIGTGAALETEREPVPDFNPRLGY
jgi:hypothetical protein